MEQKTLNKLDKLTAFKIIIFGLWCLFTTLLYTDTIKIETAGHIETSIVMAFVFVMVIMHFYKILLKELFSFDHMTK